MYFLRPDQGAAVVPGAGTTRAFYGKFGELCMSPKVNVNDFVLNTRRLTTQQMPDSFGHVTLDDD